MYTYIHLCKDVCVYIYNQMQMCAYVSVSTHMCIFVYIYIGVNKSEVEIYVCIYGRLSKLGSLFGYHNFDNHPIYIYIYISMDI